VGARGRVGIVTRVNPTPNESAELAHPCDTCNAHPGAWCVMPSGRWADKLHACRYEARRAAMYGRVAS
jgi:hypothetical protein